MAGLLALDTGRPRRAAAKAARTALSLLTRSRKAVAAKVPAKAKVKAPAEAKVKAPAEATPRKRKPAAAREETPQQQAEETPQQQQQQQPEESPRAKRARLRADATPAAKRKIVRAKPRALRTVKPAPAPSKPKAATGKRKLPPTTDKTDSKEKEKKKIQTLSQAWEERLAKRGFKCVVGVDEAGRGPLAGPVVAAAVALPAGGLKLEGVNDSKLLDEAAREELYAALTSHPGVRWAACSVDEVEIDRINILQATLKAMRESVRALPGPAADYVLVDGNRVPQGLPEAAQAEAVVGGDGKVFSVACASIIAKVTRDREMARIDAAHPEYGLKQHKGYGTAAHRAAIARHGGAPVYRYTFAPLKHMKGSDKVIEERQGRKEYDGTVVVTGG